MKNTYKLPKDFIAIPKSTFYSAIVVICLLVVYILFRQITLAPYVSLGTFYQDVVMSYEVDPAWKMTKEELKEEQKLADKKIVQSGPQQITREDLGRQSWALLHMVTGSFPEDIPQELEQQFNTFLILFAKMYPCKMCSHHFLKLLRKKKFRGSSREEIMVYMCGLHNEVNRKLKKPLYDCNRVFSDWGTCGCSVSYT